MSIPRTTISPGGTLEGNVRSYTCASNTVTEGPTESVCQINGQWSLTAYDLYCRRKQTSRHLILTYFSFCTRIFVVNTSANYWNLSFQPIVENPSLLIGLSLVQEVIWKDLLGSTAVHLTLWLKDGLTLCANQTGLGQWPIYTVDVSISH